MICKKQNEDDFSIKKLNDFIILVVDGFFGELETKQALYKTIFYSVYISCRYYAENVNNFKNEMDELFLKIYQKDDFRSDKKNVR